MSNTASATVGRQDLDKIVRRWVIKGYVGALFAAVTLFVPAGRIDWAMGWVYVGLWLLWHTGMVLVLVPTNPELIAERASRSKDAETWDVTLMSIVGLLTIAQTVVAGLDYRFGWTARLWPDLPLLVQIAAALLAAAGRAVGVWAIRANAFFSKIVRIQADRGHTVVSDGPYRYVRHPGYAGTTLDNLAVPLVLGSLWCYIPSALIALGYIVRTALEDRTLRRELTGYAEYAQRVRYRLLPGIW